MATVVRGSHLARLLERWQSTTGTAGARLPEYAALANAVGGLVRDGRLALGIRLPAERELAEALGVSRTTVTSAYRELRASGHLASRRGAGSWTTLPQGQRIATSGVWFPTEEADVIDLGSAALSAPPELAQAAAEAVGDLSRYTGGAGYHPSGLAPLREVVARRFADRGLPTHPDQVLITSGVQHAVDLILRLVVSPGQSVLVESPTYPNVLAALRAHRLRVSTDNLDPQTGWDAALLLASLRAGRPALAYVIPDFQNPTGHLMPVSLREQLPAAAHRAGTDVIADESFVDLPLQEGGELPPLAAFDRNARVLTVGGMTKPYWGGIRVGWIRAAAPVIARLAALRVAVDMAGPVLDQLVALRLLDRADQVLPARRALLARQRDALIDALHRYLPEWTFTLPSGGVSMWAELPAPVSTALAHAAYGHGVRIAPGPRFGVDGTLERFLRMPFTLPEAELVDAVRRIARASEELDRGGPAEWAAPTLVA
jgi:DNA-binding transcriptional MocR family regulator